MEERQEDEQTLPIGCLGLPRSHEAPLSSSSSSSSSSCSSPPRPRSPPLDLSLAPAEGRLVLDVHRAGAELLPEYCEFSQERMRKLQYLRLGSEDERALTSSLSVLPRLTALRFLTIRGNLFHDCHGEPLPGLLSSLPDSFSALSSLVHLDLSFNQLSSLPPCVLSLSRLSELLLGHNRLTALPEALERLVSLRRMSLLGNRLVDLPSGVGRLCRLEELDVSFNFLEKLPDELGQCHQLRKLELSSNRLRELPETLGSLPSLIQLVVQCNELISHTVPERLHLLPHLDMKNQMNRPPSPPAAPLASTSADLEDSEIPELHIGPNQHSFSVPPAGCHVFLPGGGELLFPRGCVRSLTQLHWSQQRPERRRVMLEEHEVLLSQQMELRPHGLTFLKPVEVCITYRKKSRRQAVVRKFDGESWTSLLTVTRRGSCRAGGRPARLACCSVRQFSWFVVVCGAFLDTCSVPPHGALLVSQGDAGIKLKFPPGCTAHTRTVTLKVLPVFLPDLRELMPDPAASASPLICLTQTPSMPFLQPIRVQVPLPPGVAGHLLDASRLHLMHSDATGDNWTEITSQVSLEISQIYAVFSITNFSWYWLWYTTQTCVSGVLRTIYQRMKQFRVRFLALQRKSDPVQVLLQCLLAHAAEDRFSSLCEQYEGPQPSELSILLEGEQFFASFEKGIDLSADRPDCEDGRLSFTFYSYLKNIKEVHVYPTRQTEGPVRGQVSFYRGEAPHNLPQEVAFRKKERWMATLPLRLPNADYEVHSFGDPESGYLTQANLKSISLRINKEWQNIGIDLGIDYDRLQRIQCDHREDTGARVLAMLMHWARGQQTQGPGAVERLRNALMDNGRRDVAEEVEKIVAVGRKKYEENMNRLGLMESDDSTDLQTR